MKKETGDHSLYRKNIFSLDRLNFLQTLKEVQV